MRLEFVGVEEALALSLAQGDGRLSDPDSREGRLSGSRKGGGSLKRGGASSWLGWSKEEHGCRKGGEVGRPTVWFSSYLCIKHMAGISSSHWRRSRSIQAFIELTFWWGVLWI